MTTTVRRVSDYTVCAWIPNRFAPGYCGAEYSDAEKAMLAEGFKMFSLTQRELEGDAEKFWFHCEK